MSDESLEPRVRAPWRLLGFLAALGGLVAAAWPVLSGPPAVEATQDWAVVGGADRLDLGPAVRVRRLRPDDRPDLWTAVPDGFTPSSSASAEPVWMYLRVQNPRPSPYRGLLVLRGPAASGLASFVRGPRGFDNGPRWQRLHRVPTAALELAPGEAAELLLAVSSTPAALELWSGPAFFDAMARADWALGLFLGLVFAVAIYHLGDALLLRLRPQLPLLGLLLAWSALAYVYLGYAAVHWGDNRLTGATGPLLALSLAAATWFVRCFFGLGARHGTVIGAFRGLEWGLLVVATLGLFGLRLSPVLLYAVCAVVSLGVVVVGLLHARRDRVYGLLVALGWAPFLLAALVAAGLPLGTLREPVFVLSAAAAVLAFAFAVADRAARARLARAEALRLSEERYAYAARGAHDGLFDYDLVSKSVFLAPRFFETLRLPPGSIEPAPAAMLELVHPDDRSALRRYIDDTISDPSQETLQTEVRAQFGDHRVRWVMLRALVVRDEDVAVRLVGSITDVHDRKLNELKLERRAFLDETTGLSNRARVVQHLETLIELRQESEAFDFGVLFIDVDRFKNLNDTLGHSAGDELLGALGRRLALVARDGDLVGRLGGDEFVLVLAGKLDVEDLERVARRVLEAFAAPVTIEGHEIRPSASIGITHSDVGYGTVAQILEDADVAMHEAKRAGKGRCTTFDGAMRSRVKEHFELEAQMRGALERGEMEVYYQPIIRAEDRSLAGFEALLRWNNPLRGVVSPGLFIPIAEETGMIRGLGRFALFEATAQLAEWQGCLPGADQWFVTVNVSPAQFGHDLLDEVSTALEQARIAPHRLKLEITEGLYLGDSGAVKAEMRRIAEAGVPFSLDDFGTGFSSLSYLHELPFDVLKIDRSFMRGLLDDPQSEAIVKSVLALAGGLEMATVAEGVETAEVADRLEDLGAEFFQGYYFGRPQPPQVLEEELCARGLIARRSA